MDAVYELFFSKVRFRWDMAVTMETHSLVRAWELVWGVRGPPVGTDKDGGRTIWAVRFHSNSLSAAEMQHFAYKCPFAFIDKFFFVLHHM